MVSRWQLAELGQEMRRAQRAYAARPSREGLDRCVRLQESFDGACREVLEDEQRPDDARLVSAEIVRAERTLYRLVRLAPAVPGGLCRVAKAEALCRRQAWVREQLRRSFAPEVCAELGW